MNNLLLQAEHLHKAFGSVQALQDVSLTLAPGDFLAIMGRSGSGKSTLLNVLAGLEAPSAGRLLFDGQEISGLSEDEFATWRREHVGLVFQAFHLVPTLSAVENVAFPLYPLRISAVERRQRALARLEQVGLAHRADHRPAQLSGGEQQRVAIARALINQPRLILADEPTGNLDSQNGQEILHIFRRLNQDQGVAIIIITHDPEVAALAKRTITMKDGRIVASVTGQSADALLPEHSSVTVAQPEGYTRSST